MKRAVTTFLKAFTVLCICLLAASCKKENSNPVKSSATTLEGTWLKIDESPGSTITNLQFYGGNQFQMIFVQLDASQQSNTPKYQLNLRGTYRIDGNKLAITISQKIETNGTNTPVVTPSSEKVFENATYNVSDHTLTLNYTTYPADAPVATQAKFRLFMLD
ncbi:hypothetical protein DYU05_20450 [Mucilaginibacter terrenus]|uniref:Lipocalin-like domain-containing protein n=1 Tax=Mucilaginibacter terrenus TaxID=2482727 RepID=A0A3E2NJN1_9SPHI|nr:hypothetical protein [Mucilaginibacter terrenus]RFZ81133.1 hypothetical protein DYU05_20450 [Mucilaginibacter terrenus]